MDERMERVLRLAAAIEDREGAAVPVHRLAAEMGVSRDEVSLLLAAARRRGLAQFATPAAPPGGTAPPAGWSVTPEGRQAVGVG